MRKLFLITFALLVGLSIDCIAQKSSKKKGTKAKTETKAKTLNQSNAGKTTADSLAIAKAAQSKKEKEEIASLLATSKNQQAEDLNDLVAAAKAEAIKQKAKSDAEVAMLQKKINDQATQMAELQAGRDESDKQLLAAKTAIKEQAIAEKQVKAKSLVKREAYRPTKGYALTDADNKEIIIVRCSDSAALASLIRPDYKLEPHKK